MENQISFLKLSTSVIFDNFKKAKLFTKYSQLQVDSINAVLQECEWQQVTDKRQIAYIFATGYHEAFDFNGKATGVIQRFVPIIEGGGEAYLRKKRYWPHVGYGLVQLTWLDNYKKMQKEIAKSGRFPGIDIVKNPKQALLPNVAAFIIVFGMKNGSFCVDKTSKKPLSLSTYFNKTTTNYVGARRMINPDKNGKLIEGYALQFLSCL